MVHCMYVHTFVRCLYNLYYVGRFYRNKMHLAKGMMY